MTLKDLLSGQSALVQYELMQRADRLLSRWSPVPNFVRGRYYGGPLTEEQVTELTAGLNLK